MSLSLTQKVDERMGTVKRMIISHGVTDEIFAVSTSRNEGVGFAYMVALMLLPIIGWTLGTFLGGAVSSLLPMTLRDALGIMIYGMFLAIILPPCHRSREIFMVVIISSLTSCVFQLASSIIKIGSGFVIILCTLAGAGIGAWLYPVTEEDGDA